MKKMMTACKKENAMSLTLITASRKENAMSLTFVNQYAKHKSIFNLKLYRGVMKKPASKTISPELTISLSK